MASRALLLLALFIFPAIIGASRPVKNPFVVEGSVFCDTCIVGFETPITTFISDATVCVECKDRKSLKLVFKKEGKTNSTGSYRIFVDEDHQDQICDAVLVDSPLEDCKKPALGRDRSSVILTRFNGISSDKRFANSLGFEMDHRLSGCDEVLKMYEVTEDLE